MALSMRRLLGRLKNKLPNHKGKNWQEFEYFDNAWKERIQLMAGFLPPAAATVADIGCGKMWLKDFLPPGYIYYGVDYVYRGNGCHIFDLNNGEFPTQQFDVAFVSGCLEYIRDYKWLIQQISRWCGICILSYCTADRFNNQQERISLGWVNHLTDTEITALFKIENMVLIKKSETSTANTIFVFSR